MYLWKTKKLIVDFQENRVSEKETLKYLVFLIVIASLLTNPIIAFQEKYSHLGLLNLILILFISVVGAVYSFKENSKGDNIQFVTRFTCLGVPIGIKIILLAILLSILGAFIDKAIIGNGFENSEQNILPTIGVTGRIISIAVCVLYYYYLSKAIGEVAGNKNEPNKSLENRRA